MLYVTNWQKTQLFYEFCPKKQSKTTFFSLPKAHQSTNFSIFRQNFIPLYKILRDKSANCATIHVKNGHF